MTLAAALPFVPLLLVLLTIAATWLARPRQDDTGTAAPIVGVGFVLVASVLIGWRGPQTLGGLETSAYSSFFDVVFAALALFALARPASGQRRHSGVESGAGDMLILVVLACMMVASRTDDLVVASLALVVAWLTTVFLTAHGPHREVAIEAAFKASVAGAFVGALWLYGVSLLYGVTGETTFTALATRVAVSSLDPNVLVLVSMVLILGGLCFIVAAVPFHFWAADTSSGADGDDAAFLTTGLRLAGFAVLLRVMLIAFAPLRVEWLPIVSALASLTMLVGAIAAVGQVNVRRLVACIGLTHTGLLLLGLQAANQTGEAAVLFGLVAWGIANVGVSALLAALSRAGYRADDVRDFTGLGYERPWAAALLTVCLLSLAGLPPTAGFASRWLVLSAAVQDGLVTMAVLAALTSVVLAFACLRLIVQMYMVAAPIRRRRPLVPQRTLAWPTVLAVGLIGVGVWPGPLFDVAWRSVAAIL